MGLRKDRCRAGSPRRRTITDKETLMKSKFAIVLALALFGSLMGASLADAHYLSGNDAFKAARVSTKRTAQRLANDQGTTVNWAVKNPCSQRTAHRWICDAAFSWTGAPALRRGVRRFRG